MYWQACAGVNTLNGGVPIIDGWILLLLLCNSFYLFFLAKFAFLSFESSVSYLFLILLPPRVEYLFYLKPLVVCFFIYWVFFWPILRPLFLLLETESMIAILVTVLAGLAFVLNVVVFVLDILLIKIFVILLLESVMKLLLFGGLNLRSRRWYRLGYYWAYLIYGCWFSDNWLTDNFSLNLCLTYNVCFFHLIQTVKFNPLAVWIL